MGQDNCKCITATTQHEQKFIQQYKQPDSSAITEVQISKVLAIIAPNISLNTQYYTLAIQILNNRRHQFQDFQFKKLEENSISQTNSLDKMYNFAKRNLVYVYKSEKTHLNIFDQKELQLSYLVSVFYLICQQVKLKQQIFVTKQINVYKAYILRLLRNGKISDIAINQIVPIQKQNLKYLSMNNFDQIWPFLLQKAWCKKIGGYDKAKGLSPEDCFQQIIGAPAQSYNLKQSSIQQLMGMIASAIDQKFWLALTSKINQNNNQQNLFKSRQVVYIQNYNQAADTISIRTPYINFLNKNKQTSIVKDNNFLQLSTNQILKHFDFLTIGYYKSDFISKSYQFTSKNQQQKIFQLIISKECNVNLRVIQFYSQYLTTQQKKYYRYSPVLIEVYDANFRSIFKCEGRCQNLFGIRSSNAFQLPFADLLPGLYYIRVQVDWLFEDKMNDACLVTYSPPSQVAIKKYQVNVKQLINRLLIQSFSHPNCQIIENTTQQLRIKHIQKEYKHLLLIQNTSKKAKKIKIDLKKSTNIRINHIQLFSTSLILQLAGQGNKILQIFPLDQREICYLAPFDILQI